MKRFLIFPMLLLFFSGFGQTKVERIDSLLTLGKFDHTVNTVYSLVKNGYPSITAEAWDEILGKSTEVVKTIRDEVINQYANELTLDDINELLTFYNSPIGKKLLKTNDIAAANLTTWGEEWGAKKAEDFFKYVNNQQEQLINSKGCDYLREGEFYFLSPMDGDTVKVIRFKDRQLEYMQKGIGEYSITWENDCTYILKCEKYIDESFNYMIGLETKVKLIEKNGITSKFLATNQESDYIHVSYLFEKE